MSTASTERPGVAVSSAYDKPTYQYYVLAMLVLGYVFNVIDRGVYGILLQDIKEELQASDFAMGLLGGLAFSVCYSFMGVPIARLADRWSRVNVLAIAVAVWSLATASCGLAWNYASMFFSRAMTAVGEAGGSPPSHSLISDYFPLSKRATALAIYAMSVPIGTSIGNAMSGRFNDWYGWRWAFVLVGLPGLIVALLVWLTVKEPPRGYLRRPEREAARYGAAVLRRLQVSARTQLVHAHVARRRTTCRGLVFRHHVQPRVLPALARAHLVADGRLHRNLLADWRTRQLRRRIPRRQAQHEEGRQALVHVGARHRLRRDGANPIHGLPFCRTSPSSCRSRFR